MRVTATLASGRIVFESNGLFVSELQHPGGFDIMMEQAGRDATLAYRGVGHSDDAEDDLERYLIGVLPPKERMYLQKPVAST